VRNEKQMMQAKRQIHEQHLGGQYKHHGAEAFLLFHRPAVITKPALADRAVGQHALHRSLSPAPHIAQGFFAEDGQGTVNTPSLGIKASKNDQQT